MEVFINDSQSRLACENNCNRTYFDVIISDRHKEIIVFINYVILCGVISILGIVTNIINMVIFYKQGLNTTINISFFSLAISDLSSLLLQMVFNIFVHPWFMELKLPIMNTEVQHLTTAIYREMFARITCLITVYITAERCLCIAFPLHIKQMITPKRTITIIALIYTITLLSPVPLYCTTYVGWKFYPERNISLLGLASRSGEDVAENALYFTHAGSALISFLAVVVFTYILIYKLRQKSTFRQDACMSQDKMASMSRRDRATVVMVILIASILIVCYTPALILALVTVFEPEFSTGGKYYNAYYSFWTFALLFENINSSVNIFLYFKMSTKYRCTFWQMASNCSCSERNGISL